MHDLCRLLVLPAPRPARDETRDDAYVFERRVTFAHGDGSTSSGFLDCYRRCAFVLEATKVKAAAATEGSNDSLMRARSGEQTTIAVEPEEAPEEVPGAPTAAAAVPASAVERPWPVGLPEQIKAVPDVLAGAGRALTTTELEARFTARGRWRNRLPIILHALEALGRARRPEAPADAWLGA